MENNNVVYKHTNLENGLVYYGITDNYDNRWDNGKGYQSNKQFWDDIVKYGWKNFKHEIIKSGLTRDEAKFLEALLIQETKSYLPEIGYNKQLGEKLEYEEIGTRTRRERKNKAYGFNGNKKAVVYKNITYMSITELANKIGDDPITLSQMLSPAHSRKMRDEYVANGLRYATEEETYACMNDRFERYILG